MANQTTENPRAEQIHNRLLQLDRAIPDAERYLQKLRDERSQTTESATPRSECEFDPDHLYHAPQSTVSKESLRAESGNLQENLAGSTGRWWRARWTLPDGRPTYSEIWAVNLEEARSIATQLRCEEPKPHDRPVSEFRPSRLAAAAPDGLANLDVLHSLCYLATLAGRAALVSVEDVVGDDSPLHELAHYLGLGAKVRGGKMREHLMDRILWLESIVPGLPPEGVDLPIDRWMWGAGRYAEESPSASGAPRSRERRRNKRRSTAALRALVTRIVTRPPLGTDCAAQILWEIEND